MKKRDSNKAETMRMIRDAFLKYYAKGGMEKVSVDKICKDCEIARSTFYYYYDDKYTVLEEIEEELLGALRDITYDLTKIDMGIVVSGRPLDQALGILRYLRENAETFRIVLGSHGDTNFIYKWKRDIEASFRGRFLREKKNEQSANIACTIFSSSMTGLYTKFIFSELDITEKELAIILGNLLKYSLMDFDAYALK